MTYDTSHESDEYTRVVNVTAKCGGSWPNGTLPKGIGWECSLSDDAENKNLSEQVRTELGPVMFWLEAWDGKENDNDEQESIRETREELSYTLHILRDGRQRGSG
jgi:hypothetical protein